MIFNIEIEKLIVEQEKSATLAKMYPHVDEHYKNVQ